MEVEFGRLLLSPGAKAPVAVQARGKLVCSCMNVTDAAIHAHLSTAKGTPAERLTSLQSDLQCGTACGSCVPEFKRVVRLTPAAITRTVISIMPIAES